MVAHRSSLLIVAAMLFGACGSPVKVKGHTLVWHKQLPSWVSSLGSASDVSSAMTNHITNLVTHYKGKVVAWDVVNEAWLNTYSQSGCTSMLPTPLMWDDNFGKKSAYAGMLNALIGQ